MAKRSKVGLVLGLVAGIGCAVSAPQLSSAESRDCRNSSYDKGKAASEFERQARQHPEWWETSVPRPATTPPISEIALTTSECGGDCPSYSIELYADGRVVYVGHSCVERLGERRGRIKPWRFERLARLAEDIRFFDLDIAYRSRATDLQATYTMAVRDGEPKVVMNYGEVAPPRLWAFEEAIERALDEVVWDDE